MISQPIASVIIPAFDAEAGLARALASACRQTLAEIEVIVVDDGSRDRTKEVIEHWRWTDPRVRFAAHPLSQGPSAARNTALREASGRWVVLLDADDALEPSRVARLIWEAETRELDVLADNLTLVDGTSRTTLGPALNPGLMARPGLLSLPELLQADWPGRDVAYRSLGVVKPVIRRAFLTKHAISYDESVRLGEDLLFYSRLIAQGARFGLTASAGYLYTTNVQTLSRRRAPTTELVAVNDKIRLATANLPDPDGALAALLDVRGRALQYQVMTWAIKRGELKLAHDMLRSIPAEAIARLSLDKLALCLGRSRPAAFRSRSQRGNC